MGEIKNGRELNLPYLTDTADASFTMVQSGGFQSQVDYLAH
jgi:hypothetical protein